MSTRVIAFAGHMLDGPGRAVPRFPARLLPAVERALDTFFAGLGEAALFTSAANGADLLAIEAGLRHGAEIGVVLPFGRDAFIGTSVLPGGAAWVPRFDAALQRATTLEIVDDSDCSDHPDAARFDAAALRIEQLAVERAAALNVPPLLLCVLDVEAAGGVGGTLGSYRRWTEAGHAAHVIDLRALREPAAGGGDAL